MNNAEEFKKEMEGIIIPGSTIGVHGMRIENENRIVNDISSILTKGLIINHPSGIVGNVALFGTTDDWGYEEIYDYAYYFSDNYVVNFVIAIPETFITSNDDIYLTCLGDAADYRKNKGLQNYNKDVLNNWINEYISIKRCIPKEFIVGVMIYEKQTDRNIYMFNKNYYGNLSLEAQKLFSDSLINDIKNIKECSSGIWKIADNKLIYLLKKETNGMEDFNYHQSIDLDDIKDAIEQIDKLIDYYSLLKINNFQLKCIRNYLEKNYKKNKE